MIPDPPPFHIAFMRKQRSLTHITFLTEAEFYRLQKRFKVADKLAQEALQIYRATLGSEHHLVGSMLVSEHVRMCM